MCYHIGAPNKASLKTKFPKKEIKYQAEELFHVSGFTRPILPVTLNQHAELIQEARWKLIPYWIKTEQEASKYANTLNAEAESIFDKASYKPYIEKQRGLLYVTGFFEPHRVPGKKETENYFIYAPKQDLLTLGIVYSDWTDQSTGEHYPTFSIITTAANPLLEEIHNEKKRMPLIIAEKDRDAWLFAEGRSAIEKLMIPYANELMSHQTIRVTASRSEDSNNPIAQKLWTDNNRSLFD
ncbi:SOS response-associated peptidase [Sphingobacterium sp. HJSM2_6]|uniref:SOS response-associated peptidase n=1 Tax=Sphingobacterium sp. HJSM2_6 TaxID=3366264 RepID=UPI003BDD705E